MELLAGATASTISSKLNRKVNPATARRSKLRMELYTKRKLEEKQEEGSQELAPAEEVTCLATGDTSSTPTCWSWTCPMIESINLMEQSGE